MQAIILGMKTLLNNHELTPYERFIPTRKSFAKLCENKYARKVLIEHHREPRHGVGDMVYAVSKCPSWVRKSLARGGIVLRPDVEPPINAAKGAKQYLVLPVGEPHGIVTEERWLKTRRNKASKKKALTDLDDFDKLGT